ncbi:MAG: hypothetical protein NC347_11805 [Clostridium sp.]|nr:hypothetical protein [Clostridium sp.]
MKRYDKIIPQTRSAGNCGLYDILFTLLTTAKPREVRSYRVIILQERTNKMVYSFLFHADAIHYSDWYGRDVEKLIWNCGILQACDTSLPYIWGIF